MLKKWIPLWAIPTLILFSIGTVWLRLTIVRMTYAIHQTDQWIDQTQHEHDRIQLKVEALRSPQKLEHLARTRFNFSQPRVDQIVHLKEDGS